MPRKKKAPGVAPRQRVAQPRRPRQTKAQIRVPPVAMAMPWIRTSAVTVSYVCPMCRTRREVEAGEAQRLTDLKHVPLDELACGPACRAQWWRTLMVAIQATGQQYVLRDTEWVWELEQGVVAERLAEILQDATTPCSATRGHLWLARN